MADRVDITAIKFNQGSIIVLTLIAFMLDQPWLVLLVGTVLVIGTVWPEAALFKQMYQRILKPVGLLKPLVIEDDPAPHRFAQGMAGSFLLLASLTLLVLDFAAVGWAMAGLISVLAAINLLFSFCAGCFTYYQLARLGLIHRTGSAL
jgi:hypothetical protein